MPGMLRKILTVFFSALIVLLPAGLAWADALRARRAGAGYLPFRAVQHGAERNAAVIGVSARGASRAA
jgi:hypothetical protein